MNERFWKLACLWAMLALWMLGMFFIRPAKAYAWQAEGRALTQELEGYSRTPYQDSRGVWSVGYGFNCQFADCREMSKRESRGVFSLKYAEARTRAVRFIAPYWHRMTDAEKIVITDMAYNLGNRLFKFKRLREAIRERNLARVIHEMRASKWYQQTGRRPERLISILNKGGLNG